MRVLVCRPLPAAERSAARLRALGHAPLMAPVLTIRPTGEPAPDIRPDAILLTSEAAVPALRIWSEGLAEEPDGSHPNTLHPEVAAQRPSKDARPFRVLGGSTSRRAARHEGGRRTVFQPASQAIGVPIFGVGGRTVAALREAGFAASAADEGTAEGLARHVLRTLSAGTTVLHLAGRDRKPEPERSLAAAGLRVTTWEVYEACAAATLPEAIAAALRVHGLDAALHYSRRSAALLLALAGEAGLRAELAGLHHHCLSADVAAGLAGVPADRIHLAPSPTEDALLATIADAR